MGAGVAKRFDCTGHGIATLLAFRESTKNTRGITIAGVEVWMSSLRSPSCDLSREVKRDVSQGLQKLGYASAETTPRHCGLHAKA
jgi:hypothetical protein